MGTVLNLRTVEDTRLWKQLEKGFEKAEDKDCASKLAPLVVSACEVAVNRIKLFPYYHRQFTLHDSTHLLRVTELMGIILDQQIESLNPIEVSLLILSAFFHDQGMVPEADDWKVEEKSPQFLLSWRKWEQDHPNMMEIKRQIEAPFPRSEIKKDLIDRLSEHRDAHRTNYLRVSHGERSNQIVNKLYGTNGQLSIFGLNLAPILGKLCESHVLPASYLSNDNEFRVDQSIGRYSVNLRYLAIVLRLADILDFDCDRTPEALLRTINISSPVSLLEWAKHRSVEGWEISKQRIRYTLSCEHPAYQKAAFEFMDAIDHELRETHTLVRGFPRDTPAYYRLDIPQQVERDRIEPKNNCYRYADLEFGLSRDEIVKLLMTDKLYNSNSLFVRELVQNSLDALRERVATHGKGKPDWNGGEIALKHFVDPHGNQVVQCIDNGIGMDEDIVRKFLTNVGRSYYRSPEFEQRRVAFRQNGVDFDPCAQFGIGFMSCFMFGDRIRILTRRDYGPGRGYGEPLRIEINGLGGLLVIRDGSPEQPIGTTIEVIGPRKPPFMDEWEDEVQLCTVIDGYALATEFPIVAVTEVEEIATSTQASVTPAIRLTAVEEAGLSQIEIIEYAFSKIDQRLGGYLRIGLLVDEDGIPCLANSEARWELKKSNSHHQLFLTTEKSSEQYDVLGRESATCIDGILVCGMPGRKGDENGSARRLGWRGNRIDIGNPFLLDIRGDLKPVITPARTPPETRMFRDEDTTWNRVNDLVEQAEAMAWEPVLQSTSKGLKHEDFWRLSLLHRVPVHLMPKELLWSMIHVPTIGSIDDVKCQWVPLAELKQLEAVVVDEGKKQGDWGFRTLEGKQIDFGKNVGDWNVYRYADDEYMLRDLIMRFVSIHIVDKVVSINIENSHSTGISNSDLGIINGPFSYVPIVKYFGEAKDALSVEYEIRSVNSSHPIVAFVQGCRYVPYRERNLIQDYCASVVWTLSDKDNLMALGQDLDIKGRQFKRLGSIYNSIDWEINDKRLAPPYRLWTKERGAIEINADDLAKWSRSTLK